jgi:hypothetical protein
MWGDRAWIANDERLLEQLEDAYSATFPTGHEGHEKGTSIKKDLSMERP